MCGVQGAISLTDTESSSSGSAGTVSSDTLSVDIGGQSDEQVDGPPAGTVFLFATPDNSAYEVDVTVTVSTGRFTAPRILNQPVPIADPHPGTISCSKTVSIDDLQAGTVTLKFI